MADDSNAFLYAWKLRNYTVQAASWHSCTSNVNCSFRSIPYETQTVGDKESQESKVSHQCDSAVSNHSQYNISNMYNC